MIDDFFQNQLDKYIKELDMFANSRDQNEMYQKAHKLVGASRYAGAVRIAKITDKMQKYVPKLYEEREMKRDPSLKQPIPNFPPYEALHKILMREVKNTIDDYKHYKETGSVRSPLQPQSVPTPVFPHDDKGKF